MSGRRRVGAPPAREMIGWMLVIFDFDDTAAVENVARLLLDRFGDGAFERIQADYSAGKLLFKDYQELAFLSLQTSVTEMRSYAAETARLRPGFSDAVAAAERVVPRLPSSRLASTSTSSRCSQSTASRGFR